MGDKCLVPNKTIAISVFVNRVKHSEIHINYKVMGVLTTFSFPFSKKPYDENLPKVNKTKHPK